MTDRENAKEQKIIDYKQSFTSDGGMRVLKDLISKTSYGKSSVCPLEVRAPETIDPTRVVYEDGQRSVIAYIVKMCQFKDNFKDL